MMSQWWTNFTNWLHTIFQQHPFYTIALCATFFGLGALLY